MNDTLLKLRFSANVKALRMFYGWTQDELCRKAGIKQSFLSLVERAKKAPTIDTVERICRGFKVPAGILLICDMEATPVRLTITADINEQLQAIIGYLIKKGREEATEVCIQTETYKVRDVEFDESSISPIGDQYVVELYMVPA